LYRDIPAILSSFRFRRGLEGGFLLGERTLTDEQFVVSKTISMYVAFSYIDTMFCFFVGDKVVKLVPVFGSKMLTS